MEKGSCMRACFVYVCLLLSSWSPQQWGPPAPTPGPSVAPSVDWAQFCNCSVDGVSAGTTTGVAGCADHLNDGHIFCYTIGGMACPAAEPSTRWPGAAYLSCVPATRVPTQRNMSEPLHGQVGTVRTNPPIAASQCDGSVILEAAQGHVFDGPLDYAANMRCSWLIRPVGSTSVCLNFSLVDVEARCSPPPVSSRRFSNICFFNPTRTQPQLQQDCSINFNVEATTEHCSVFFHAQKSKR